MYTHSFAAVSSGILSSDWLYVITCSSCDCPTAICSDGEDQEEGEIGQDYQPQKGVANEMYLSVSLWADFLCCSAKLLWLIKCRQSYVSRPKNLELFLKVVCVYHYILFVRNNVGTIEYRSIDKNKLSD